MSVTIHQGDCREVLRTLPAGSVHCCATSPPYLWLRDYQAAGQVGLESSVGAYVETLVDVFRLVRTALHPTGSLWLNLGSSYAGGAGRWGGTENLGGKQATNTGSIGQGYSAPVPAGWKPKDLIQIPHIVAEALREDGWYLRSAITLVKSAPMPESCAGTRWERCRVKVAPQPYRPHAQIDNGHTADVQNAPRAEWQPCPGCARCERNGGYVLRMNAGRPTSATEMLFLLTKEPSYYFDQEAIRRKPADYGRKGGSAPYTANGSTTNGIGSDSLHQMASAGGNALNWLMWEPQPLGESHFAAFPPFLPAFCVKAGTSERGCCPSCLAPWARVVEKDRFDRTQDRLYGGTLGHNPSGTVPGSNTRGCPDPNPKTIDWKPTCKCQEYGCPMCDFVLELEYATRISSTTQDLSCLPESVPCPQENDDLLQQGLPECGAEDPGRQELPTVREDVPAAVVSGAVLQQVLLDEVDSEEPAQLQGVDTDEPGIHCRVDARSSRCGQDGVRDAASLGDGEGDGSPPISGRSGSPHQRDQDGQSAREPSVDGEARPRRLEEPDVYSNVSALPRGVSHPGECPHCAVPLVFRPPNPRPAVILDPFGGAGTTGLVADRLGRDAILVELNPTYAALAKRRLEKDAGLFSDVTVALGPAAVGEKP